MGKVQTREDNNIYNWFGNYFFMMRSFNVCEKNLTVKSEDNGPS